MEIPESKYQFPIELGLNLETKQPLELPLESFNTHYHLIGATGSGKTTAMETILQGLFTDGNNRRSFFIIDPLGGFAKRLLRFIADKRYCTDKIRERLVYFEPANQHYTTTIQTLDYTSRPNQDYQVARAMDLLLRGFEAQDFAQMPRLRKFLHQAVFDIAQLGMPLSIAQYLLKPKTSEHKSLLANLPLDSQLVWNEVVANHGAGRASEHLDSTRNRVSLISDFILLQRMFSSTENLLDIPRFMDEGRIVIINLTPGKNIVPMQVANMMGSVIINEVLSQALARYDGDKAPTESFLVLDEFQRFLGPDIYDFLPIIRNLGLRMILANQSFSQLVQGEVDMRPMIGQARSRLMFANDFEDANILAEQIASLKWNPDEIKHQVEAYRSRIVDHQKIILNSGSSSQSKTKTKTNQRKQGLGESTSYKPGEYPSGRNTSKQTQTGTSDGGSEAASNTDGWSEHLLPIYEEFTEVTGVQFRAENEVIAYWRKQFMQATQGKCYGRIVEDASLYHIDVSHLPLRHDQEMDEAIAKLIEDNYKNGPFITADAADKNFEMVRHQLLSGGKIRIDSHMDSAKPHQDQHGDVFDH